MSLDDTLAAIDGVLDSCAQCGRARGDSPSDDFCGQECQQRWMRTRTTMPDEVLDRDRGLDDTRRAVLMEAMECRIRDVMGHGGEEAAPRAGPGGFLAESDDGVTMTITPDLSRFNAVHTRLQTSLWIQENIVRRTQATDSGILL